MTRPRLGRFLGLFVAMMMLLACRFAIPTPPTPPEASHPSPATISPLPTLTPRPTPTRIAQLAARLDDALSPTDFLPRAPVILHFSRAMDRTSAAPPLHITPATEGTFTWDESGTVLIFVPREGFAPGEIHTLTLDPALTSRDGERFETPPTWEIEAAAAPEVERHDVWNGERYVRTRSARVSTLRPKMRLIFSQPMAQAKVEAALHVEPDAPIETSWEDNILIIEVTRPLDPETPYTFVLDRAAANQQGIPLPSDYEWTVTPRPLISQITAPTERRPDAPIAIEFNYPMETASVQAAFQLEPSVPVTQTWNDDHTVMTLTPQEKLPADTEFSIRFTRALRLTEGDRARLTEALHFTTPPPILRTHPTQQGVHPQTTLRVTFDRPMDHAATEAALQITPPISGTFDWDETTLIFQPESGHFAENTPYTVTLGTAAKSAAGRDILNRPYTWHFQTGEFERIASFGRGPNAQVLDADGRRAVQFVLARRSDTADIAFELYRLSLEQFLDRYASGFRGVAGWEFNPISTEGTTSVRRWTMQPDDSLSQYENIQETTIPDDVPPGLYILNLDTGIVNDQLILALTSNTLMVKQAEGQIVAWVTDINGAATPNAEVGVYARDGSRLQQGRADAQGVYRTTVATDPQPLIVVARQGDDLTISGLSNEWRTGYDPWRGWWQTAPAAQDYAAHIITDRPIYRPGHTVYFKAIIRRDADAVLSQLPPDTPITVRLRDARNNVVRTIELATNEFGAVDGEFQLAENIMLGEYAVEIEVDGETHRQDFDVEEYRKPDYEVTLQPAAEHVIAGEEVEVLIESDYYFGEPVADAPVKITLYELGGRYAWDTSSDDPYIWYQNERPERAGRTDDEGRLTYTFEAELQTYGGAQGFGWHTNLQESTWGIEATVNDGSHQTVSNFTVVKVYNTAEKIELDTGGYVHTPGEPFPVEVTVETIAGEPVADRTITLTARRWSKESGEYDLIIEEAQATTDAAGQARANMTIEESGYYHLHAAGVDHLGNEMMARTYALAYRRNFAAWRGQAAALHISADRESYAPGETARLFIESDADLDGPALLTFERGTTRREQLIELNAPLTTIETPIQPDDMPNIHVTVNAWEPQDETSDENVHRSKVDSRLHTASVNLSVPATEKRLTVTLSSDHTAYAPRETVTFTARITDYLSRPVAAELSLALVDEAIFALSSAPAASIFTAFYDERANIVRTYNALALRRALIAGGMGGGGGGGGGAIGAPRSDFPDTAAWIPTLRTGDDGVVTFTITLPDSLTSWRLTAKATTADSTQVGEARMNIRTRQPIVVRPILPRFLTSSDELNFSAFIHNYSDEDQAVDLSLEISPTTSALLEITSPLTHTVNITSGARAFGGWTATAQAAGQVDLIVKAAIDGVTWDAVQLPLTIHPLAAPDVATQVGQFQSELTTTFIMPEDALAMSTVELDLSRTIAGSLLEGLEYLTGFPYGCVEQTMSKALPNAVVGRAIQTLGVSAPTLQADLPAKINASVQRLYGYQHNDGGWGWWYDDDSDAYQTAWVVFGLHTTREAGYEVDPQVIQRGIDWIDEHLDQMDVRTRAYALYSVAVAGSPNVTATLEMAEQLQLQSDEEQNLGPFSRAGLALALEEAGESEIARTLIDALAKDAIIEAARGEAYWTGDADEGHYSRKTMASTTRSTALALDAFVRIAPDHELIPYIVRWLMGQRQQHGWGSTNETSYAIIALTDHLLATSYGEIATTSYAVELNGEVVAEGALGRGEPAISLSLPADTPALRAGENQLRVTKGGEGQLYYVLNRRAYLAQERIDAAGEIEIQRRYLPAKGNQAPESLESIKPGQLLRVELEVTMPEDGSYIIVEDALPGGLEALNERLNTTSHVAQARAEPVFYWREYGYNHKEVRDDRVTFFITEMPAGTYTYTYYARATHAGTFAALPVEVSAMYDATRWGRSASQQVIISE